MVAYPANISLLYFIPSMNTWHRIPDGEALPDYISEQGLDEHDFPFSTSNNNGQTRLAGMYSVPLKFTLASDH